MVSFCQACLQEISVFTKSKYKVSKLMTILYPQISWWSGWHKITIASGGDAFSTKFRACSASLSIIYMIHVSWEKFNICEWRLSNDFLTQVILFLQSVYKHRQVVSWHTDWFWYWQCKNMNKYINKVMIAFYYASNQYI